MSTTAGKYQRRPVLVDAVRWTGDNLTEIITFLGDSYAGIGTHVYIRTLEGTMQARIGDWIIRGTRGECYPCKSAIFADTYDPVEEQ